MEKKISKEEIMAKTIEMISAKFGVDYKDIAPESNFTTNLGADSLDLVEMVMSIEKTFGIVVPDSDAQRFKTVGDVMDYLGNKLNAQ